MNMSYAIKTPPQITTDTLENHAEILYQQKRQKEKEAKANRIYK